jgi:hypothetical protein
MCRVDGDAHDVPSREIYLALSKVLKDPIVLIYKEVVHAANRGGSAVQRQDSSLQPLVSIFDLPEAAAIEDIVNPCMATDDD